MTPVDKARLRRRVAILLVVLPIVIAGLVLGGVFLGFYVGELMGLRGSAIMAVTFSTLGLLVSLIIAYVAAKRTATI